MNVMYVLLPLSLLLGLFFLVTFIWSVRKGQYDDMETPAYRMLLDDENNNKTHSTKRNSL